MGCINMSAATTAGLSVTHEARAGVDISAQALVSDIKVSTSITASLAEVNVSLGARVAAEGGQICTVGEPFVYLSEQSIVLDAENNTYTIYLTATRSWEVVGIPKSFGLSRYNGEAGVKIPLTITLASQESFTEPLMVRCGDFVISASVKYTQDLYTRLSYLESTGEQYINTGYVVQEDDVIEMMYISTSATSEDKALFGCMDDNGRIWFSIFSDHGYTRFGSTSSTKVTNGRCTYKLTLKKQSVTIGNGNSATPDFEALPQVPLYLFARNVGSTSVGMYGYCRCLSFSIKKSSGEVVMNMMPSKRNTDGAIGMLDLVSGEFFVNEGAGADFICGAEVRMSDDYEAIPYVTFNKDKLFDLGIVKNTYTIDVMFKRSESSTSPYLYGCLTSDNTATVSAYLTSGGYWRYGSSYAVLNTSNTHINRTVISNGTSELNFTVATYTKSTFTTPNTVVLGGCRSASNKLYKYYQGNIYFIRIAEGDTPIIDYYPCKRLSDGVEGFWDCVTQTFIEPM